MKTTNKLNKLANTLIKKNVYKIDKKNVSDVDNRYSKYTTLSEIKKQIKKIESLRYKRQNKSKIIKIKSISERLFILRESRLKEAFKNAFGNSLNYNDGFRLVDNKEIKLETNVDYDYDYYAKSYGHPKKWTTGLIHVPLKKMFVLQSINKVVFDNILNISAREIKAPVKFHGVLYKTKSLKMGQGRKLNIVDYYVARRNGMSYHADSKEKAISGVNKKVKNFLAKPEKLEIHPKTKITRSMYKKLTGACTEGIKSFLEKNDLANKKFVLAKDLIPLLKNEYGFDKFMKHYIA